MNWTETGAGIIHAAEQRFWHATGENADIVASRMTNGAEFLDSMVQFAIRGGPQPSMSVTRAREIMKSNFLGVEEGMRHLHASFSRFELAGFAEVPATDEELEEISDTHVVVAVPSLSIVGMREKAKKGVFDKDNAWHLKQALGTRPGMPRYQMVRKTAVQDSTNKTWGEQQSLLGVNDEVPSVRVLNYVMAGHYLATDEKLFADVWVRTSDVDSDGYRVSVRFNSGGVCVVYGGGGNRRGILGLASARKSS